MEKLLGDNWELAFPRSLTETEKQCIEEALLKNLSCGNQGYHDLYAYLKALKIVRSYPLTE